MKEVILINTGEIFESIVQASKETGVGEYSIYKNCVDVERTPRSRDGELMLWQYVDEYKLLSDHKRREMKELLIAKQDERKVVLENTGEIFNDTLCACKAYNLDYSTLKAWLVNKHRPRRSINGKRMVWKYLVPRTGAEMWSSSGRVNPKYKRGSVTLLNTGEVFRTIVDASYHYDIQCSLIQGCATRKGRMKKLINGRPMVWRFTHEVKSLSEQEIKYLVNGYKIDTAKESPVILLNTGEVFQTIIKASKKFHLSKCRVLNACLQIENTYIIQDKEPLVFRYFDKVYGKMTEEERLEEVRKTKENYAQYHRNNTSIGCSIVLLENEKVFPSIRTASRECNIVHYKIRNCCREKSNVYFKETGEYLQFRYIYDYWEMKGEI